jgi:tetratricopeptide (TPR) repeat protein
VSSDQAKQLRQQGIAAAKAGQNEQARQLLQQSIRLEPRNEAAWLWLASVARDERERLFCLQKLLEINPNNEMGLKALEAMGAGPAPAAPSRAASPAKGSSAPSAPAQVQTPGVPIPDSQRLAEAQSQIDSIVRQYLSPRSDLENIRWVRKTRGRAGERDALALRLYIGGAVLGVLAVIAVIVTTVLLTNAEARRLVFAPTWTPSHTPTMTPTNTPGFTPTPSPTPELTLTPSPTIPPEIRQGDIAFPPTPTAIYPPLQDRLISGAVNLINRQDYANAIPTLSAERDNTEIRFNPNPYYYEAIALARDDNSDRALEILQEAETRLEEAPNENFKPLVDLGFAQVYIQLAEDADRRGLTEDRAAYLAIAQTRADAAIAGDPRLSDAYVILAKRHMLAGNPDAALSAVNGGLTVPELANDLNLIVQKGEIYFEQGDLDRAAYQAYYALYIDPTIEQAYLLQIKIALAKNDPGLAVIYAQNYLFFYPGSAAGYKLLGDARMAEGNTDLALAAYTQALAAEEATQTTADALVARAAIYVQQRRFDLAQEDLTAALNINGNPDIQALRMQAAYQAGSYTVALSDAQDLLGTGALPEAQIQLIRGQALIDTEADNANNAAEGRDLIASYFDNLPNDLRPVASEYLARANLKLGFYQDALEQINTAIELGETGTRYYLRGQILEELGQPDAAQRDYEWVVAWGEIYPYPFLPDVRRRLEALTS